MPRTSRSSDTLFATRIDLPETTRGQLAELLNRRLADAIDLQTQCKQATERSFIALHRLLDEVHEEAEYAGLLAERVVHPSCAARPAKWRNRNWTSTRSRSPRERIT
jgi:hypothetical protein